nr:MAG TPA: nucelotide kinase [Caudoviricetes sp.]
MINKEDIKVGLRFHITRNDCLRCNFNPIYIQDGNTPILFIIERRCDYKWLCTYVSFDNKLFAYFTTENIMEFGLKFDIVSKDKIDAATSGMKHPIGVSVLSTIVPKNDWIANYAFVGGSRGGNKRNFMSCYLGKFNIPQYEDNVEQPNESASKKTEQVSHPSHYAWLKDLCGVEPLDICRHLDFNTGNAIKYLLRKDKMDGNKTKTEKRIEDLRKAIFYINDEINELNGRNMEK